MNVNIDNAIILWIKGVIQHYNHNKYWRCRSICISPIKVAPPKKLFLKIRSILCLLYVKRCDAFNCASMGTDLGKGARFKTPPILLHGLNGIIIGHDAQIGSNVTILQQVTIEHGGAVIGDNVFIGKGAYIKAGVKVGNNVRVGANCVVIEDIPDNATVVLSKPRIIIRKSHE